MISSRSSEDKNEADGVSERVEEPTAKEAVAPQFEGLVATVTRDQMMARHKANHLNVVTWVNMLRLMPTNSFVIQLRRCPIGQLIHGSG